MTCQVPVFTSEHINCLVVSLFDIMDVDSPVIARIDRKPATAKGLKMQVHTLLYIASTS